MSRSEDLCAVLEGIVYGDDPKITPGDRLRAAEQLQQLAPAVPETFTGLLAGVPDGVVAQLWDDFRGDDEAALLLAGDPDRPRLSAALREAVEARAATLAAERVAADEAAVEQRAHELAAQLYQARAFRLAGAHDAAQTAATADDSPAAAPAQPAGPGAPDAADGAREAPPGVVPWPERPRRGRLRRPGGYR